ncbi:MAG: RAMP superfamily CRISPR-associated protein [Candidatus Jordarchaeum sp.]|uniref:RAMP superfamily CRISPR-associated protein n=1 Tax=Candidatus Jordarchaeum sp. TaxID=2823881 RepID=UPI004049C4E4
MTIHDYYLSAANLSSDAENQKLELGKKKKQVLTEISKEKDYDQFYPSKEDIKQLPQNSLLLKISFTLKKPYTSKDEGEFHVIEDKENELRIFENPIVRDKFLGCPMVRPSTWKGQLRFASERVDWDDKDKKKKIIRRLFGSGSENDENSLKGRLYFFPTFFEEGAGRDVITPLDRKTRTPVEGRSPINLEVMKPGKNGEFYLLYFPYPKSEDFKANEVKEDFNFLAQALMMMFYVYGFSAKKSSGFGVINETLKEGNVWIKSGLEVIEKGFSTLDELVKKMRESKQ